MACIVVSCCAEIRYSEPSTTKLTYHNYFLGSGCALEIHARVVSCSRKMGIFEENSSSATLKSLDGQINRVLPSLLRSETTLCTHYTHNILIRNRMSQTNSLWQVLRTRTPY